MIKKPASNPPMGHDSIALLARQKPPKSPRKRKKQLHFKQLLWMAAESLLLLQNRLAGSLKINWAMWTRGLKFPAYLSCLPIERRCDNNADLSRRRCPGDKSSEAQVLTALLKTALCFCQMLSAHEQLQLFPAARAAANEQVTAAGRRSSITTFILTVLRTYNEFDL